MRHLPGYLASIKLFILLLNPRFTEDVYLQQRWDMRMDYYTLKYGKISDYITTYVPIKGLYK
jgi:hypothetical protein